MCNKDSSLLGYVVSTGKLTFQMSIVFPFNMLEHPPPPQKKVNIRQHHCGNLNHANNFCTYVYGQFHEVMVFHTIHLEQQTQF
jgi:hypothetical protein